MEKICILGCGGFIGSHLTRKLLQTGDYFIEGVDITFSKIENVLDHKHFNGNKLDIYDFNQVKDVIAQCDTVINLIALCNPSLYNTKPIDVIDVNFNKPYDLVKFCCQQKIRLIHFSTSEVYGKTIQGIAGSRLANPESTDNYLLNEDQTNMILGPVSAQRWSYAAAKQLLERLIYAFGFERGLEFTIIRPLNFIGPRMDYIPGIDGEGIPRVLACFMEALMFNKPLQLVDGGRNKRTFTFIDDAVDAVIKIVERRDKCNGEIFNIGNPSNECSVKELAEKMVCIYHNIVADDIINDPVIKEVSSEEFYGKGYEDCDRRVPDITKAKKLLDWHPETDLDTALHLSMKDYIVRYIDNRKAV
jgi:UDP-apiose/xylose synthase